MNVKLLKELIGHMNNMKKKTPVIESASVTIIPKKKGGVVGSNQEELKQKIDLLTNKYLELKKKAINTKSMKIAKEANDVKAELDDLKSQLEDEGSTDKNQTAEKKSAPNKIERLKKVVQMLNERK